MSDYIFPNVLPVPNAAQLAASELLDKVDSELQRRALDHRDGWYAFWYPSNTTSEDIADAMGTNGALWLQLSRANVEHIRAYAEIVGKSLDDYLPLECQSSLREIIVNANGSLTIS